MDLDEYASYDGIGLADLLRAGEVNVPELLSVAREAIEKVNPTINAVIEVYEESSLDIGSPALAGTPFAGVPSLRKDLYNEAGRKVEYGSLLGRGRIALQDDAVIREMKNSGVVFIGRSTTSEFGLCTTTESTLCGDTRNPYDLTKSVGGSSGGAAAAVAAGMVPFAQASDGGGSIRIPASCCGLVGLKASRQPVVKGRSKADLNAGTSLIVARTVRDVATMFSVVEHNQSQDTDSLPLTVRQLRVAVADGPWEPRSTIDPEIVRAVHDVASVIADLGGGLDYARPAYQMDDFWDAMLTRIVIGVYEECLEVSLATGRSVTQELLEPMTWMYFEAGQRSQPADLWNALAKRDRVVQKMEEFFLEFDILITPSLQMLPPVLGTAGGHAPASNPLEHLLMAEDVCPNMAIFNMTGQPAITVPTGVSTNGLPIGVQIVGRHGTDHLLLALAEELENRLPWRQRIPTVHVSRPQR